MTPPGTFQQTHDVWGRFATLCASLPAVPTLALADDRVLALHPAIEKALRRQGARIVRLRAGERLKQVSSLDALAAQMAAFPRNGTVLAIGGGTVGDFSAVFAHLFKRGVGRFIMVPTTLLAAVDSSVGGKGAVNVAGVKNALGVFHWADETWVCPEVFATLSAAQRREGVIEAWKMAATLDAHSFAQWHEVASSEDRLIRLARALKDKVVCDDPYETKGKRVVLNFGHTFGHVIETVSGFRIRHGEAVGLGMLCALDVGVRLQVTPEKVAAAMEKGFALATGLSASPRRALARVCRKMTLRTLAALLKADKKASPTQLKMVLISRPGRWVQREVPMSVVQSLFAQWKKG